MDLNRYPRVRLVHAPTPLEPLLRLSKVLGGPQILIKRDDCTGLATGGNKTRKLEFLIGEALALGADTIVTHGATQSNHARQTAAAAARHGLSCHLVLENRTGSNDPDYLHNGNVLLDVLCGATIEHVTPQEDMNAHLDGVAERLRGEGRRVYAIPGGGSNVTGALGYVACAMELVGQLEAAGLSCRHLVHATGSSGTQAGLVAGLKALSSDIRVHGIGVRAPKEKQEAMVTRLAAATAERIGSGAEVTPDDVEADCDHVGPGYGIPAESTLEAIGTVARLEGILLDPVYSAKGMAGLMAQVRAGRFGADETVIFLHTGGAAALPAYMAALAGAGGPGR